jgi:two-component system, OmpR family, osmolarity sensor histidine kinase EnvZ
MNSATSLVHKLLPRTLFWRSAWLIAGVVLIAQLATSLVYYQFVQKPRLALVANFAVVYLDNMRDALNALPEAQRQVFLQQMDQPRELRVARNGPPAQSTGEVMQPIVRLLMKEIQQRLAPGESLVLQVLPERALWVSLVTKTGELYWVVIALDRLRIEGAIGLLLPFALITVLSILGGLMMHRSINRPLRELQTVASAVGRGDKPHQLLLTGPTEVIELKAAFNRMVSDLDRADADRRLMLAGVSHDLRTPVTRLRLALELMHSKPSDELKARMESNLDELDAALTQFLDFARDERDEAMINADLRDIARECVANYEAQGVTIALELGDKAVPVRCRPQALTRALRNLIDNALKYSQGGVTLLVRPQWRNQSAALLVRDEGEPLDGAELSRLRQPFTRRQNARSGGPAGTGLGLAIVERIAALHDAQLQLVPRAQGGLEAQIVFLRSE